MLSRLVSASLGVSPSKMILLNASTIAGGFLCWKILRPNVTPIAPASIAPEHISMISLAVLAFGPPAITIGTGQLFVTLLNELQSPVYTDLIISAPASAPILAVWATVSGSY